MPNRLGFVSRRRFLASTAALAALPLGRAVEAWGIPADAADCKLVPEQEQGPFYIADELFRSDMVEGKPGVPLSLRIVLMDARTCKPLRNAIVDVWQCDALGVYSGFTQQSAMGFGGGPGGGPPGPPPNFQPGDEPGRQGGDFRPPGPMGGPPMNHPSDKKTFLRGIQRTDVDGAVAFNTVFPGFYMGRTNHIHFKVRTGGAGAAKSFDAGHTSHTGQVFFPEAVATELMQHEPYRSHTIHRTTQAEDHVFNDQHGKLSVAHLRPVHADDFAQGMHAEVVAFVDPTASPVPVQPFGGPGGRPE